MNDLSSAVAVYSEKGSIIHLHVDGFRTQKPRYNDLPDYPKAVCGAAAHVFWKGFPPKIPGRATGRVWLPLAEAIALERSPKAPIDPRYPHQPPRRWCAKCVGMALEWVGSTEQAIDLLLRVAVKPTEAVCPECRDGKCRNCTEQTLNDQDEWVPCGCPNHGGQR